MTHSLIDVLDIVLMIEKRQEGEIMAPGKIVYRNGWTGKYTLMVFDERYGKSPYGQHLKNVVDGRLKY